MSVGAVQDRSTRVLPIERAERPVGGREIPTARVPRSSMASALPSVSATGTTCSTVPMLKTSAMLQSVRPPVSSLLDLVADNPTLRSDWTTSA